jgi:hypothetical protein
LNLESIFTRKWVSTRKWVIYSKQHFAKWFYTKHFSKRNIIQWQYLMKQFLIWELKQSSLGDFNLISILPFWTWYVKFQLKLHVYFAICPFASHKEVLYSNYSEILRMKETCTFQVLFSFTFTSKIKINIMSFKAEHISHLSYMDITVPNHISQTEEITLISHH